MTPSGKIDLLSIPWSDEPDNHLKYKQLISSRIHGPDISVTLVDIDGEHLELKTEVSSRVYVIVDGDFTFHVTGMTFTATKDDLILIERGDVYSFSGKGKYLVINGPAFESGDDIYTHEIGKSVEGRRDER
jgi:mannose-6-phosphate isomerase-like protein (cupin superfamily)